ncbi:MAG: hypothetical protein QGG90_08705 [Nitrospinota bacterium]|nr:hypothetical protein [Nitrospinota bacterium]
METDSRTNGRPGAAPLNISPDDLKTIARVKRFFERFHGDAVFRRRFSENPATAIRDYRLGIDPLDVRHL